jgi:signal transduction histidine kinase
MGLSIGKTSLRVRLYLLTAMVFIALLIAGVSAFRTARTSAAYTERQAEINVNLAVREIARQSADYETGRGDYRPDRPLPPHLRELDDRYKDKFSRMIAVGLGRFEDVSGGFCTIGDDFKGFISVQSFSSEELSQIKNACRESSATGTIVTKKLGIGENILHISVAPLEENNFEKASVTGVFAVRQTARTNMFADRFNLLTQGFLLLSIIVSVILAFLTLRDWRTGMFKIETGLNAIAGNLAERIEEPKIVELNRISREINDLAENLQSNLSRQKQLEIDLVRNEKLAALGRVASGVAHEVRNPLASMKLKIQLAERHKSNEAKLEKTFDVLLEEIERLDGIVKKLLEVSRPAKLNFTEVNLKSVIESRIALLREKAESGKVRLETSLENNLEISGDGKKLTQVFDNLLLNGLEAMPEGGTLFISAHRKESQITVEIADEGAGLSEEAKARLFEPFFTTKDNGTGLGLAISREIIESHHGRLYATKSAKGAKFVIELPVQK